MRTRLLFSVAVAALIAGIGAGNAQNQMKQDQGTSGGAQMNAPSQHGGATGPGKSTNGAARSEEGGKAGMRNQKGTATENNEKAEPKGKSAQGAQGPSRGEKAGTTGQGGQEGGQMKGSSAQEKSTTGQGNPSGSNAQQQQPQGTSRTQSQQQPQGAPSGAQTQQRGGQTGSTTGQGATGSQGAVNLSTEQRTKITTAIKSKSTEFRPAENVNFSISVGARVPRSGVTLYTLPSEVVTVYPAWRGFKFILVRGEIIVIDPNTYEIVAVLPA